MGLLPKSSPVLSPVEHSVVEHFIDNHSQASTGRFAVPLWNRPDARPLGKSHSAAVLRFFSVEHSLGTKGLFKEFHAVMREHLDMGHLKPSQNKILWTCQSNLPIHLDRKESSTTTKLHAVLDASAKSSSVSLNDQILVDHTVHSSLVDVLICVHRFRVVLSTDVSKIVLSDRGTIRSWSTQICMEEWLRPTPQGLSYD